LIGVFEFGEKSLESIMAGTNSRIFVSGVTFFENETRKIIFTKTGYSLEILLLDRPTPQIIWFGLPEVFPS
jgi:hypothetical protein